MRGRFEGIAAAHECRGSVEFSRSFHTLCANRAEKMMAPPINACSLGVSLKINHIQIGVRTVSSRKNIATTGAEINRGPSIMSADAAGTIIKPFNASQPQLSTDSVPGSANQHTPTAASNVPKAGLID